jgi:hypothetical protein
MCRVHRGSSAAPDALAVSVSRCRQAAQSLRPARWGWTLPTFREGTPTRPASPLRRAPASLCQLSLERLFHHPAYSPSCEHSSHSAHSARSVYCPCLSPSLWTQVQEQGKQRGRRASRAASAGGGAGRGIWLWPGEVVPGESAVENGMRLNAIMCRSCQFEEVSKQNPARYLLYDSKPGG